MSHGYYHPSQFSQETANQVYAQALPQGVRDAARETLRRYQEEARRGKPWPRATPSLVAALDAKLSWRRFQTQQSDDAPPGGDHIPPDQIEDVEV